MAQEKPIHSPINGSSTYLYTDHWAYTYIQLLQDRGHLQSLYYSIKPYRRMDIAKAVISISVENLSPSEKYWIELLKNEMKYEIQSLQLNDDENVALEAKLTAETKNYYQKNHFESDFYVNPEINYRMDYLAVSLRGRIDNGLLNDPTYTGRKADGLAARLEDGYGLLQFGKIDFFIGRSAQSWGPFNRRSLILSDHPYTYDRIGLNFLTKNIAFHSSFAKLNSMTFNNAPTDRYLSAHRLDIKLNNGINFGFSETAVYGGPDRSIDFSYMNPFTIFMNAQTNDGKEANENLAFDFFIPLKSISLKGQILVDDFILDGPNKPAPNRKTSSDRLGFLFGIQMHDVLIMNSQWDLLYERVGSYTYNVKQKRPWQSYTYDGRGLGGETNDRDLWNLSIKYFPFPKWIFDFDAVFFRKGERSLSSNDFEDSTFVKLPFPSGEVQSDINFALGTLYQHSDNLIFKGNVGLDHIINFKHTPKKNKTYFSFAMTLQWILFNNFLLN